MKKGSHCPRYSTTQFIEYCKNKHNNKYDYSKTIYRGSKENIIVICPIHGEFTQNAAHHKNGIGCPKCFNDRRGKQYLKTTEQFIADAKKIHGDKYDYSKTIYEHSHKHVTIICPEHGEFKQSPNNHLDGRGCPTCGQIFSQNNFVSRGEIELQEYIKSIYQGTIYTSCRSIITPEELDVYIPDLKIAFEFDGLYWHSEKIRPDKNFHLNKTNKCLKEGINLIHIFEDEWTLKNRLVKSRIKHLLGITPNKIYARNCEVKEISQNLTDKFLTKYHIQGSISAKYRYGLFYHNHLVAVMTFNKARFNSNYDFELLRYATVFNFSILGGASKLLAYFRNNNQGSIISYADKRWSVGNLYEKIGFKAISDSEPNYFYLHPSKVIRESRLKYQKHLLKEKLDKFDPNLSEVENMHNNNYYRIWDCGNKVYILE